MVHINTWVDMITTIHNLSHVCVVYIAIQPFHYGSDLRVLTSVANRLKDRHLESSEYF